MEHQLFENLFPTLDANAGALSPLVDTLADMLYDSLRPAYIHLQDISALCQLVDMLQREVNHILLQFRGHKTRFNPAVCCFGCKDDTPEKAVKLCRMCSLRLILCFGALSLSRV